MIIKYPFKTISNSLPMAFCWYCKEHTNKALYFPDGSEVWCCDNCYQKHGVIRKHIRKAKSLKISGINEEKNTPNAILKESCNEIQAHL